MTCSEFRERIGERLGGELPAQQELDFVVHYQGCAACQKELKEWQRLEAWLREGWPSEDAPPLELILPRQTRRAWFELASVWFARASVGLVTICLLLLVLLRPTIQWDQTGLRLAFGPTASRATLESSGPTSGDQVQAWIQAAVQQGIAQERLRAQSLAPSAERANEDAARWSQVGVGLRVLEQRQALLWQQMQEQGLYLQRLWQSSSERLEPARDTQLRRQ